MSRTLPTTSDRPSQSDDYPRETNIAQIERSRLVIADDDPVVLAVLIAQLKDSFEVVGTATNGESTIQLVERQRPDAALIDLEMPCGGGLHATRGIHEVSPETVVVILSIDESTDSVLRLLKAGAMTYLRKGTPAKAVVERLQQAINAHRNEQDRDRDGCGQNAGTAGPGTDSR